MTAILLCGYRPMSESEFPLIEARIRELRACGAAEIICVLSGKDADEQLRVAPSLIDCELVFDTNDEPCLATNLKAGLAASEGQGAVVQPVEIPCPPREVWTFVREGWRQEGFSTPASAIQLVTPQGAPCHFGFPLVITRTGSALIRQTTGFRSLLDTRLKYLHLVFASEASLASDQIPL